MAALAEIGLERQAVVLVEHRALGILKDDVGQRVATRDLGLDLGVQVVVGILGLPVAMWELKAIHKRAIGALAVAEGLLQHQRPPHCLRQGIEQRAKGQAGGLLVGHALRLVGRQSAIVGVDGLVVGEVERHRCFHDVGCKQRGGSSGSP